MSSYKITCCSTVDMPPEWFAQKDIPYAKYHFEMDGQEYPDDMGQTISFEEFYARIGAGAMPVTSQINTEAYIALFEPILASGQDILHLTLSSGITGSINSARITRDELLTRYPDRKLYIVDSLAACSGYGLLVDAAWEQMQAGMDIDELFKWLEERKYFVHHWFFTTDLKHLKRGGRVSAASAAVGTLLNICPLLNVSDQGKLIPRAKIRGKKHVITETVGRMTEHAENGTGYSGKCFIANSACREDAEALAGQIKAAFPKLNGGILINSIGTVIGAHTGPGTVALFFWGDKRVN